MKKRLRVLCIIAFSLCLALAGVGGGQSQQGITIKASDNSFFRANVTQLVVPPGTASVGGSVVTLQNLASFPNGSILTDSGSAGNLLLGGAPSATPANQSISAQAGSGTNIGGASLTVAPGNSTGNATPATFRIDGAALGGASGTTATTNVDRLVVGMTKVLNNGSPVNVTNLNLASNTIVGVVYTYTVEVFDGTNLQVETGAVAINGVNKAGAFTMGSPTKFGNVQAVSSGTLSVTFAISSANPAVVSVNANSSLAPSAGYPRITYQLSNLTQQSVLQQ